MERSGGCYRVVCLRNERAVPENICSSNASSDKSFVTNPTSTDLSGLFFLNNPCMCCSNTKTPMFFQVVSSVASPWRHLKFTKV